MLQRLRLHNFKSWTDTEVRFAPITAFFGSNSSGKSSLIQFLLLLKQTKDSADRSIVLDFGGPDSLADLGSFGDAVTDHDLDEAISWGLNWGLDEQLRIADPSGKRSEALFRAKWIRIESRVRQRGATISNDFLTYHFSGTDFGLSRRQDRAQYDLTATGDTDFRFLRTLGRKWNLPGPAKSYAFPDQAKTYFQNSQFLSEFETAYVKQMDQILHLGPIREFPQRQYLWSGSSPVDVGRRGERTIDAILAATARGETRNKQRRAKLVSFQEVIALWLQEVGLIFSFRVAEIAPGAGLYRVFVKPSRHSSETLITDVGFGVSQILPALVLLYYVPSRSTIILEQPEIHLHPSVQARLADLIISTVKSRDIQVIVESHSEHLLQRLTRRVAEGDRSPYPHITPNDIRMYFCESADGESKLTPLELNLFGGIENWPNDFFGDQFGEISAREEAAARRRASSQ